MKKLVKVWKLPFGIHVLAAAAVLLLFMLLAPPWHGVEFDEGITALQAKTLVATNQWVVADQAHWVDPSGQSSLIVKGEYGSKGDAFYMKHPAYPILLSWCLRAFGEKGIGIPSFIGTLLSAIAAFVLLEKSNQDQRRVAFWLVVLGTPLLVDSNLVLAHSLGAAFAGLGVACALRWKSMHKARYLLGFAGFMICLYALRTESLLFAAALCAVLGVETLRRWKTWKLNGALISLAVGGYGAVFLIERWARHRSLGIPGAVAGVGVHGGFADQLHAARRSIIEPNVTNNLLRIMLSLGLLLIPIAALLIRKSRTDLALIPILLAVASYFALAFHSVYLVTGLLVCIPGLWLVIWLSDKTELSKLQIPIGMIALFVVAVVVTQYPDGGAFEWGGRFFALALPLICSVAAVVATPTYLARKYGTRVFIACAAIALSLLISISGMEYLHTKRASTHEIAARFESFGKTETKMNALSPQNKKPIVLYNVGGTPYVFWSDYSKFNWILSSQLPLSFYFDRFQVHNVKAFTLALDKNLVKNQNIANELAASGYSVTQKRDTKFTFVWLVASE